jgi:hypothetical protein
MADINGAFEVDGLVKPQKELESLMMSNPEMEKRVQKLIRKVLMAARREVGKSAKDAMKADPRQAYKAVKTAVYRQILGGSVSILNKRGTKFDNYEPPRTLQPGQRGGNRVPRSQRTQQMMSYDGSDRAFILRFLNQGTSNREAGSRGGHLSGNRGRISPRNFFSTNSHTAMQKAARELTTLIDDLIKKEMK